MGTLYLVDTSAWIFAIRRSPHETIKQRIDALLALDVAATCGLLVLELLGGTANEQEFDRLQARLRALHCLPIDDDDWHAAARLAFRLRRVGITVPFTDVFLAAIALRHEAILIHADRDFDLIARQTPLAVESLVHLVATSSA